MWERECWRDSGEESECVRESECVGERVSVRE